MRRCGSTAPPALSPRSEDLGLGQGQGIGAEGAYSRDMSKPLNAFARRLRLLSTNRCSSKSAE